MKYWIWLSRALNYRTDKLKLLLSRFGSAEKIYNADIRDITNVCKLSAQEYDKLSTKSLNKCEEILSECEQLGIKVLGYDDPMYPERLRNIDTPPCCLYYKGELPQFDKIPTVCLVGTRKADAYSCRVAWSLSARLALANFLIVSGGALGIDSASHKGALDVKRPTVAVLACGINYPYLKQNSALRDDISFSGCLISEYPPNYPLKKEAFHLRNRLLSGLSLGVVIIEAGEKSGALITARCASEQGRDVFVITGKPDDKKYAGSNALLRDGAIPVFKTADVISEYIGGYGNIIDIEKSEGFNLGALYSAIYKGNKNMDSTTKKRVVVTENVVEKKATEKNILKNNIQTLSKNAELVYNYIDNDFFTLDDLVGCGIPVSDLFSIVTELELQGLVEAVPGGRYAKRM